MKKLSKRKSKLRVVPRRKSNLHSQPMLNLFLQALASMYPKDKLAAGVTLAWLPDRQKFYGSVCRYPHGCFSKPPFKEVICSVYGDSPMEVIHEIAAGWYQRTQPLLDFNVRMQKQLKRIK